MCRSTGWTGPPPARREGADFTQEALDALYEAADGYPYFVQAYGKVTWDAAAASPVTTADVTVAGPQAEAELAVGFFGSRYDRATPAEREYMRAMAMLATIRYRRRRSPTNSGVSLPAFPRPGTASSRRGLSTVP